MSLVAQQLRKVLPPEAVVIGLGIKPEAEQMLSEAIKMKKEEREQGVPATDLAALKDSVRAQFEPLRKSLVWQSGGQETYDNYSDSATAMATLMVGRGMKPKVAAEKAYESMVSFKYEFEDTWRAPRAALGGDTTMTSLRDGALATRYDVGDPKPVFGAPISLMVPAVLGSAARPEDLQKQWRETVKDNGFWVTSPGDGGLTLYVKSGLGAQPVLDAAGNPVRKTWDELSAAGNSVKAARMSDVFKKGVRAP
jgi:hypothetical protein